MKMKKEPIKIDDLDISVRCFQSLKANGIKHLYMLSDYKPEELISFSKKSIEEIEFYMKKYGISWREKEI
jgi:DNA-directed RNA polymerase alpha subunit